MSQVFIVALMVCALCTFAFILRKIKKSEITIADATFWFLFAGSLVLLAAIPQIAFFLAGLLGMQSPSNFVFLYVVAILFIHQFVLTVELSKLRARLSSLVQYEALGKGLKEKER